MFATRSVAFPAATLFVSCLIFFLIQICCSHDGIAGLIGFLPFILFVLLLILGGAVFGIASGVTTIRLSKILPQDKRSKVLIYAWIGITLSLADLYLLYWLVWVRGLQ